MRIPAPRDLRSAGLLLFLSGALHARQLPDPAQGFTLFAPLQSTETLLLDESGAIAHTWPSNHFPGLAVYLRPNGNLLRTIHTGGSSIGGTAGGVQELAWDGSVVWDYRYDGPSHQSHHDVEELPNGNLLMIAWEHLSATDALAAGRQPSLVQGEEFSPDHVIEVQRTGPTAGQIVWEWHAFDHLIQDYDPGLANYGAVADHPELIDVNFPPVVVANGDWLHINGIDYSPELDQIALSVHNTDEIWIIDHSTTSAEAAGHSGGNSGLGGDLLYRWGNPWAYGAGTPVDRVLNGQHDANWVEPGFPGEGHLLVFNNRAGTPGNQHSEVLELAPPVDSSGLYPRTPGAAWGPAQPSWTYAAPNPTDFYSGGLSGAVRLENGHTLICSGSQGWLFEVNPAGQLVWEYTNSHPNPIQNAVFKARRYEHHLWCDPTSLSVSAGGFAQLDLLAGSSHTGRIYLLLGSASGTAPGLTLDGHLLPLNPLDPYFLYTLSSPGAPPLGSSLGLLDSTGSAVAGFALPAAAPPQLVGLELHHAFAVLDPLLGGVTLTSNAAGLALSP